MEARPEDPETPEPRKLEPELEALADEAEPEIKDSGNDLDEEESFRRGKSSLALAVPEPHEHVEDSQAQDALDDEMILATQVAFHASEDEGEAAEYPVEDKKLPLPPSPAVDMEDLFGIDNDLVSMQLKLRELKEEKVKMDSAKKARLPRPDEVIEIEETQQMDLEVDNTETQNMSEAVIQDCAKKLAEAAKGLVIEGTRSQPEALFQATLDVS